MCVILIDVNIIHTFIFVSFILFFSIQDILSRNRNEKNKEKGHNQILKRDAKRLYRMPLNSQFVLKRAYDPIIYPLEVVVLVINVEQQPTTEQKPAKFHKFQYGGYEATDLLCTIVRDVMDDEIESIKDFDGFDPSAKGQIKGMRILAKAIVVELQREA